LEAKKHGPSYLVGRTDERVLTTYVSVKYSWLYIKED